MISLLFQFREFLLYIARFISSTLSGEEECLVCGGFSNIMPLCRECGTSVFDVKKTLSEKRCSICGKVLVSEEGKCMECRTKPVFNQADGVFPLFGYRLWNKEMLFVWKMMGVRSLSPFFAGKIKEGLEYIEEKVIVPVPPRKGKIARKGWDQIEDLCGFLEMRYGFTVLRILERKSGTEQKKLDRNQRIETIGKSFVLVPEKKLKKQLRKNGGVMPEVCVLIDDILTTGSTAESCAEVLKEGGVKKVKVVSLFTAS